MDKATLFIKRCLNILHIKLSEKTEKLLIQIFKFIIVGGIATILDFLLLYVFKEFAHLPVVLSNTLSFSISTIYNYIASVRWVFDVKEESNKKKNFITFISFSIFGLLINDGIMYLGDKLFNMSYMIVKLVATAIVMIFNFITRKLFLE